LLVGTTTSTVGLGNSIEGVNLRAEGRVFVSADSDYPLNLSRNTSDGDIAVFRKDGATVGSIGTIDGDLLVHPSASGHKGLRFGNGYIAPTDNSGSVQNATTDLGLATHNFKDLYLSGGVYLGGTGSANLLDDYEEGTFTPEAADAASGGNTAAGYDNRYGYYRKIGSLCYLNIQMVNIDTTGMTAGADLVIRGLPFTQQNLSGAVSCGTIRAEQITVDASCYGLTPRVSANNSYIVISENISGANDDTITVGDLNSGAADIWVSITMQLAT